MEKIVKSAQFAGQVMGLVFGSKLIVPATKMMEKHLYLAFDA